MMLKPKGMRFTKGVSAARQERRHPTKTPILVTTALQANTKIGILDRAKMVIKAIRNKEKQK